MSTPPEDRAPVIAPDGSADSVTAIHEPIMRELEEPRDGFEPTPTWWLFMLMGLLLWGGWYLGNYSGTFQPDVYDERPGATAASAASAAPAAPLDLVALGRRLYGACAACHQADGRGVPGAYPPLAGSEWVVGRAETTVRILLHGVQGPLEVRGTAFNQVMPAWKHLKDEQIAALTSHIRSSFGNAAGPVAPELVTTVRRATSGRTQPWSQAELRVASAEASATAAPLPTAAVGARAGTPSRPAP
jgi:mono/diheme cytochrome c family protein